jgi:hypothetical protein
MLENLRHVGVDRSVLGRRHGEGKRRLEGRLVPAGETATRVSSLKLRHSCVTILAILWPIT